MIALRLLRIAAVGAMLAYLFHLSQQAGVARGNEEVPGVLWAVGVVSGLIFVRAITTELTHDPRSVIEKDLLWGICAGGIATILIRTL